jgi:hypothetical protein
MGFFTNRERDALGKSLDTSSAEARLPERRPQRRSPEIARQDFVPRRRPAQYDPTVEVRSPVQKVTDTSLQAIDALIAKLRARREQILEENSRVQRAIIEYAHLTQTTVTTLEALSCLKQVVEAPETDVVAADTDSKDESRASSDAVQAAVEAAIMSGDAPAENASEPLPQRDQDQERSREEAEPNSAPASS